MPRIIIGLFILCLGVSAIVGVSLFKFVFAVFFILLGIKIITGRSWHDIDWERKSNCVEDFLNEVAVFSPLNLLVKSEKFSGGKMVMIFSGGEIDLSEVKFEKSFADLEIVCIFGGCRLIVPKDCNVNVQGTTIIGGYDNKTVSNGSGKTLSLNVRGVLIFGGIEILNK